MCRNRLHHPDHYVLFLPVGRDLFIATVSTFGGEQWGRAVCRCLLPSFAARHSVAAGNGRLLSHTSCWAGQPMLANITGGLSFGRGRHRHHDGFSVVPRQAALNKRDGVSPLSTVQ